MSTKAGEAHHSNWTFRKDIEGNFARLSKAQARLDARSAISVLLITEKKWGAVQGQEQAARSQFKKLKASAIPTRILLWERLTTLCSEKVAMYLTGQLGKVAGGPRPGA